MSKGRDGSPKEAFNVQVAFWRLGLAGVRFFLWSDGRLMSGTEMDRKKIDRSALGQDEQVLLSSLFLPRIHKQGFKLDSRQTRFCKPLIYPEDYALVYHFNLAVLLHDNLPGRRFIGTITRPERGSSCNVE